MRRRLLRQGRLDDGAAARGGGAAAERLHRRLRRPGAVRRHRVGDGSGAGEVERQVEDVGDRTRRGTPACRSPPRGRMIVRLSPDGSDQDSTASGGAAMLRSARCGGRVGPRAAERRRSFPESCRAASAAQALQHVRPAGPPDRAARRGGGGRPAALRGLATRRRRAGAAHRRQLERRVQLRQEVGRRRRARSRHAVERLHRVRVRGHVRLRCRLVQRRAGERIAARAAESPNRASSESPPPPAAGAELGNQRLARPPTSRPKFASPDGWPSDRARSGGRRRRGDVRRERIPVERNAARRSRRRRARRRGGARARRRTEACERIGEGGAGTRRCSCACA